MSKFALYVPLEAKPGKEKEVGGISAFGPSTGASRGRGRSPGTRSRRDHRRFAIFGHLRRRSRARRPFERQGRGGTDGQSVRPVRQAAGHSQDRHPDRQVAQGRLRSAAPGRSLWRCDRPGHPPDRNVWFACLHSSAPKRQCTLRPLFVAQAAPVDTDHALLDARWMFAKAGHNPFAQPLHSETPV